MAHLSTLCRHSLILCKSMDPSYLGHFEYTKQSTISTFSTCNCASNLLYHANNGLVSGITPQLQLKFMPTISHCTYALTLIIIMHLQWGYENCFEDGSAILKLHEDQLTSAIIRITFIQITSAILLLDLLPHQLVFYRGKPLGGSSIS